MNCPYCNKRIVGMTGLMEAQNLRKHLNKCRKQTVMLGKKFNLLDALKVRAESGQ